MGVGRDVVNGLRLDRNEKVDNWPDKFYEKIFSKLPKSFGQLILIIMAFTKNFQNI